MMHITVRADPLSDFIASIKSLPDGIDLSGGGLIETVFERGTVWIVPSAKMREMFGGLNGHDKC